MGKACKTLLFCSRPLLPAVESAGVGEPLKPSLLPPPGG
jgi:hypothetical protein